MKMFTVLNSCVSQGFFFRWFVSSADQICQEKTASLQYQLHGPTLGETWTVDVACAGDCHAWLLEKVQDRHWERQKQVAKKMSVDSGSCNWQTMAPPSCDWQTMAPPNNPVQSDGQCERKPSIFHFRVYPNQIKSAYIPHKVEVRRFVPLTVRTYQNGTTPHPVTSGIPINLHSWLLVGGG